MINVTGATRSIICDKNKHASLRSRNNNREIRNLLSNRRNRKSRTVPEPLANTVDINEADTNADTCCL